MTMEWEGKRPEATSQPQDQLSDAPVAPTSTPPCPTSCHAALHFLSFSLHSLLLSLSSITLLPSLSTRVKRAGSINPVEPQFPHL